MDGERSGAVGGGGDGFCDEHRFQITAAEASEDASGERSLLFLRTDKGLIELSPPGRNDRDNMLVGFELLLASFGDGDGRSNGSGVRGFEEMPLLEGGEEGSPRSSSPDSGVARRRSRRWEGVTDRGGGNEGMVIESADEDTDSDDHQHQS